ncbi:MAG: sulfatase-like hydrolase/transferase [Granulosicoccus sp.]
MISCSDEVLKLDTDSISEPAAQAAIKTDSQLPDPIPDSPDPRPDIVVVVADDMRWDIMSGQGHPFVRTPNIDQFAKEAAMMENAFVPLAVCSPSRAAILTGKEPHLASAPRIAWRNNSFLKTQRTFAQDLQAAGYTTAYIGKWHLGDGSLPKEGFDHWESFDWLGDMFDPVVHINGKSKQFTGYADDILSSRADQFMKAHADSDKPIFLMVGLKAPHLQFEHPKRYDDAYADVEVPKPDSYNEDFSTTGKVQEIKDWLGMDTFPCGLKCFQGKWDTYIKKHYRAILGLDDSVGTLRAATSHRKKTDNTLFIYTSDNGYTLGEHGLTEKHMIYEEPIRVPFLIDFPGTDDSGYRFDGMVSTLDIAPTALDYAQVDIPEYMTGRSLKPLIDNSVTEESKKSTWRDELFLVYPEWQVGLRTDQYKYIVSLKKENHIELYDLYSDPNEMQTLHDDPAYADVLLEMQQRFDALTEANEWSRRITTPVDKLLVSSPIDREKANEIAQSISMGPTPDTTNVDAYGTTWREIVRTNNQFYIGNEVPPDSTVLVALPLERGLTWDPHVRVFLNSVYEATMYIEGERLWDNHEHRPLNYPNPPIVEKQTLMVMRFDGQDTMRINMSVEAPEGGALVLPLEDDMEPTSRIRQIDWLGEWNEEFMCSTEW